MPQKKPIRFERYWAMKRTPVRRKRGRSRSRRTLVRKATLPPPSRIRDSSSECQLANQTDPRTLSGLKAPGTFATLQHEMNTPKTKELVGNHLAPEQTL